MKKDSSTIHTQHQQSEKQTTQPSQPPQMTVAPIKKKKSVVNLFGYGNISELLSQQSSSQQIEKQLQLEKQQNAEKQILEKQQQQSVIQSQSSFSCDTSSTTSSKYRYNAFNNISFDTNLDFLSFVSLYRSFR